jgi:hypothetical protein
MTFPYGQTVTLISRTVSGQDDYNNDVYAETSVDIFPCVVQPAGTTEAVQWTDQVSTDLAIFMPYGTDIEAVDAVLYNGLRYEVQGKTIDWISPFTGRVSPVQIRVSLITGASV